MASISSTRSIDDILAEADSRAENGTSGLNMKDMLKQYEVDGTYLSREVLQLVVYALYGPEAHLPENARVYHDVDVSFSLRGLFEPVSDLYRQTEFMVKYLEDPSRGDGGRQLVEGFVLASRRAPGVWDKVLPRDEFSRAWSIVSLAVHFRPITPSHGVKTFRDHFEKAFPRPKTIENLQDFDVNLKDILEVDIKILTTDLMEEHLLLEGDTLKISKVTSFNVFGLRNYDKNRAARALGISSLGEEILYAHHALYGRDQLYQLATSLEILKLDTSITQTFGPHALALAQMKPFLLSDRTRILKKEIQRRRTWLPSLIRDIKKQAKSQPFLFYGAILAVFFGVLQCIQTITSIWALALAIKAQ